MPIRDLDSASDVSRSDATRSETDGRPSSRPPAVSQLVAALACESPAGRPAGDAADRGDGGVDRPRAARGPGGGVPAQLPRRADVGAARAAAAGTGRLGDGGRGKQERGAGAGTPQRRAVLSPGDAIECGQTFLVFDEHPADESVPALPPAAAELGCQSFHPDSLAAWSALARVGPTRVPVVLQGETGTGKELAARALHVWSGRTGPFVAVNCGALPEPAGGERALRRTKGCLHRGRRGPARSPPVLSGGTLLLDEVGELPPAVQVKLLRGAPGERGAAGRRRLSRQGRSPGGGRHPPRSGAAGGAGDVPEETLFARLTGLEVELPPLRERRADSGCWSRRCSAVRGRLRTAVRFRARRCGRSSAGDWPHNVRELEKALALAVALAGSLRVELTHLPRRCAPRPSRVTGRRCRGRPGLR